LSYLKEEMYNLEKKFAINMTYLRPPIELMIDTGEPPGKCGDMVQSELCVVAEFDITT